MEEKSKVNSINFVEFQWLHDEETLKVALQNVLGSSGQLLKKFYTSSQLNRKVHAKSISRIDLNLVNHLKINPDYIGPNLKIIFENEDYLVLHKSLGIHCHPLKYEDKNTVLNFLAHERKWGALKVNSEQYDRGLLYRLDEGTSGVLILSKNQKMYDELRANFFSLVKQKFYLAIVKGKFNKEGNWEHFFSSSGIKGSKQIVSLNENPQAQRGSLECRTLQYKNDYSLVLVKLKTGLRHQIRAQLAYLGFPILGDTLYGGDASQRIFLHAWRYQLEELFFEDEDAELFNHFLDLNSAFQMGKDMLSRFKSI